METKRKNWSREETIAAFNLYCKIPFSKMHKNNPEIIKLAHILNRTPSSVALKLVNFASLDPVLKARKISGMKHVSNLDKEIWKEFHSNWEQLAFESEEVLAKLRRQPIEQSAHIHLDEVPKEGKERESLIKVRINQSFFRSLILASYDNKCCITGLAVPDLLVASHIIPWSHDHKVRMSPHNGLCLNSLHDKAFDRGLMTITSDYRVKLSPALSKVKDQTALSAFFNSYEGKPINLPDKFLPDLSFLKYHNEKIFIRRI